MALRFLWGYLHSCVRSCLQSADSCSNTIKDDVICIITSGNACKCAYRSRADSNNSNTPWSRTLLQLPFRYGSVCKRQRNVLQSFQRFQNRTLVFLLHVCQTRIQQPIFRPGDAFLYRHGAHLVSWVSGCVYCGRDGVVAAQWSGKPNHHSCCLTESPKGKFFLSDQTSCLKCKQKRENMSRRLAFAWRNDNLQCVLEAEGSVLSIGTAAAAVCLLWRVASSWLTLMSVFSNIHDWNGYCSAAMMLTDGVGR